MARLYIKKPWSYELTPLPSTLRAKRFTKITFSADKIYYNFSEKYPNITNPQSLDRHFNIEQY